MALDEALLLGVPLASVILRFFHWAGPAATFGYSQSYELAREAASARGLGEAPVVRRSTGGGIVFHDGDLTFSLVFPWESLSAPLTIYEKIHRGVLSGLKDAGVQASLSGGREGSERLDQCFHGPEAFDIVDGEGRKILGGALRRRAGRGLYQGSLRLAGAWKEAVERGLTREWGCLTRKIDPGWLRGLQPLEVKYQSDAWNKRR